MHDYRYRTYHKIRVKQTNKNVFLLIIINLHGEKTLNNKKTIDDVANIIKLHLNTDIILAKLSSFNEGCIIN